MADEDIRWQQRFSNYKRALAQLTKFMEKTDLNELEQQGLIQAFEYTHELAWNTLKDFLESRGNTAIYGSRDATREAFQAGIITDGDTWMSMIKSRNLTSHTYNEEVAKEIVDNIINLYFKCFGDLKQKMTEFVQ